MKTTRTIVAGAWLACALSTSAQAAVFESHASASITNFTFTLIDLDPTDGIAPSIRFSDEGSFRWSLDSGAVVTTHDGQTLNTGDMGGAFGSSHEVLIAGSSSVNLRTAQALAEMTTSAISLTSSASVDTAVPGHDLTSSAGATLSTLGSDGDFLSDLGFSLGAKTALRVQGQFSLNATLHPGPTPDDLALASLFLSLRSGDQAFSIFEVAQARADGELAVSVDRQLDFTLENSDASERLAYINMLGSTQSIVATGVSPVPEPQAIALMLAGLGGVAVARRRRQA